MDTSKIALPYPIAKQVALDLNSWDSLKARYEVTHNILKLTEQKVIYKDSIIGVCEVKNQLYMQQIIIHEQKEQEYNKQIDYLNKSIKHTKVQTSLIEIGCGVIITACLFHILLHC